MKKKKSFIETGQPIMKNEQIKELLDLLKENQTPTYIEVTQLISHVSEMERQLSDMLEELKSMRQEMKSAKNPSLRSTLQKTYKVLGERVAILHQHIFKLKEHIVEESKHILENFKKHGIIVLNGITGFLKVKPILDAVQTAADKGLQTSNRAISKINAFSAEYHETGRHLKNMNRSLRGKPLIPEAKENGKIAGAFTVAIRAERFCITAIQQSVKQALTQLTALEQSAKNRSSVIQAVRKQTTKSEAPKDNPIKIQVER